jgi:uncharacterized protein YprB with RNaseH-like and TPR domain
VHNREQSELRRRLDRLGNRRRPVKKRASEIPTPVGLPPGDGIQTPLGETYRIENTYAMEHRHGVNAMGDLLLCDDRLAAEIAAQPDLLGVPLKDLVFLDTETTGLAGGAGTLIFLVGIGAFVEGGFRMRQYFMRDPAEEPAMLYALQEDLEAAGGYVTFNGRAFDIPLLEMRYVLGLQRQWLLSGEPQFDLLFPARRLWRRLLPDCTLGTLEREVCGVRRTGEDVPGEQIPELYMEFLRTGDGEAMQRVVYHNTIDVLSLVTLATQILARHGADRLESLSGSEALAVARWHQQSGRAQHADQAYRRARDGGSEALRLDVLRHHAGFLKRHARYEDVLEAWQAWHALKPDDPRPCVELSKYFEWIAHDLDQALHWAKAALVSLTHWEADWRRDQLWAEIEHRLERISRKQGRLD